MNDVFLQRALRTIEGLTPKQLRDGLREAGLELVSVHSGKKLSEVPYDEIWIGMEVVGCDGDTGIVDAKYNKTGDNDDNVIRIEWSSCSQSAHWHYWFNNVTVK